MRRLALALARVAGLVGSSGSFLGILALTVVWGADRPVRRLLGRLAARSVGSRFDRYGALVRDGPPCPMCRGSEWLEREHGVHAVS